MVVLTARWDSCSDYILNPETKPYLPLESKNFGSKILPVTLTFNNNPFFVASPVWMNRMYKIRPRLGDYNGIDDEFPLSL